MGHIERNLTLWVTLCIVAGIALGNFISGAFQSVGALEVAQVNPPVALLIRVMIIPMLLRIDLRALHQVRAHWLVAGHRGGRAGGGAGDAPGRQCGESYSQLVRTS